MSNETDYIDMNESPFPMFWDKEQNKRDMPKTAQEVPGFEECYPSSMFFDKKHQEFQPSLLSSVIQKKYHIKTMKDNEEIYIYNPDTGIYEHTIGNLPLKKIVAKYLGSEYLERYATLVIDDLKVHTDMSRDDFKPPLKYVNVINGVIDISDLPIKELLPHSPDYFFTWRLPVAYKKNGECPVFLKALEGMLPNEISRTQIQEMFGWCLWRDYHIQDVFVLIGDGNNGKDTLLNVLIKLLGKGNYSSVPLQALCEDKFMAAELYQKMANVMAELPKGKIKDSSIFKSLTGGTSIPAQHKFGHPFEFVNFAKLIFAANEMPDSYDKTFAYYRRWMIILFAVRFGTTGHPIDKHILEKITTPDELSGILNWALEGLQRLHGQEEFTGKMTVEEIKEYYEQLTSPINAFISENIIETNNQVDFIPKDYLMEEIGKFCEEKKLLKPSPHQLTGVIKRNFSNNVWLGLKFADKKRQKRYDDWYFDVSGKCVEVVLPQYEPEDIA